MPGALKLQRALCLSVISLGKGEALCFAFPGDNRNIAPLSHVSCDGTPPLALEKRHFLLFRQINRSKYLYLEKPFLSCKASCKRNQLLSVLLRFLPRRFRIALPGK